MKKKEGFTLLEILISLGILGALFAGILIFLNPFSYFQKSRNNERTAHAHALLNAITTKKIDAKGEFLCGAGEIPATSTRIRSEVGGYDALPCLYPIYLLRVPKDPNGAGVYYTSTSSYYLGYDVWKSGVTGRIVIEAPFAED